MRIKVAPQDLPQVLQRRMARSVAAVRQGAVMGAHRGKAILVRRTPRNTGATANRWEVQEGAQEVQIYNGAPHIGIIESGARPHPVSVEGLNALARWAQLKLGLAPEEAQKVANAIAWKLRKHGQEPTFFIRDSMKDLKRALKQEMERALTAFANRRSV